MFYRFQRHLLLFLIAGILGGTTGVVASSSGIDFSQGPVKKWRISISEPMPMSHDQAEAGGQLSIRSLSRSVDLWSIGEEHGNVTIGSDVAHDDSGNPYQLTVNGGIYALDLRIRPTIHPDYVFTESYPLLPLNELKAVIKGTHRLPGIPSSEQVLSEGISVAEMQAKLLEKIEELTLYLIEVHEKNQRQDAIISGWNGQKLP